MSKAELYDSEDSREGRNSRSEGRGVFGGRGDSETMNDKGGSNARSELISEGRDSRFEHCRGSGVRGGSGTANGNSETEGSENLDVTENEDSEIVDGERSSSSNRKLAGLRARLEPSSAT